MTRGYGTIHGPKHADGAEAAAEDQVVELSEGKIIVAGKGVGTRREHLRAKPVVDWPRSRLKRHPHRPADRGVGPAVERAFGEVDGLVAHHHTTDQQAEAVQRRLWERRSAFLAEVEHRTLEFDDLWAEPDQIGAYLDPCPTEERRMAAITHVRTETGALLNHNRSAP